MTDDVICRAVEMMKDHWGEGDSITEEGYFAFAEFLGAAGLLAAPKPDVDAIERVRQIIADHCFGPHTSQAAEERAMDIAGACVDDMVDEGLLAAPSLPVDREALGQLVREVWIDWAHEQPDPKPSWLVPWEGLAEPDREVDRRIGETLARAGISAGVVAQPPAWWNGQEVEWNSTGDTWLPGIIIAPLAPVVALIKLHDNGQRLNVETRHLRARDSSREAGQP